MSFGFELLKITDLMVHRIYERKDDSVPEPRLSHKLTKLENNGLDTLQKRIVKALGSGYHGIEMDIRRTEDGSFFRRAALGLHDSSQFINTSGEIANLLNEAQASRRLPGGIVVIMKGVLGSAKNPFIGVIKAEVHEGFLAKESEEEVIMSFIDSLALTPNQKLYKIGIMSFEAGKGAKDDQHNPNVIWYRAFLYDHNMTAKETRSAAAYFYSNFLGFEVRQTDKKLTRDFYELTKKFIAASTLDDEAKMDIQNSLYVELKVSNKTTVQITEFADTYLPEELRDDYANHMLKSGFPTTAVTKDLDYLKNVLRRRKLRYSNNIVVTGPSENFHKLVEVVAEDTDSTTLKISGKLQVQE